MLRNAAENSVIADLCHVARACGYSSYVGTDDLSVSLPSHRSNTSVTIEVLNVVVLLDVSPYNLVYSYGSCRMTMQYYPPNYLLVDQTEIRHISGDLHLDT